MFFQTHIHRKSTSFVLHQKAVMRVCVCARVTNVPPSSTRFFEFLFCMKVWEPRPTVTPVPYSWLLAASSCEGNGLIGAPVEAPLSVWACFYGGKISDSFESKRFFGRKKILFDNICFLKLFLCLILIEWGSTHAHTHRLGNFRKCWIKPPRFFLTV